MRNTDGIVCVECNETFYPKLGFRREAELQSRCLECRIADGFRPSLGAS